MASPRKKSKGPTAAQRREEKRLAKQELDKLICYSYARCRNASHVAKEYGVNRMYVTRAWDRLSDSERDALIDVREQVDEELNRKLIRAEQIAGDPFISNIVEARELLGRELIRRCKGEDIRMISDKNLTSLVRLVASLTTPDPADKDKNLPDKDIRSTWRRAIEEDIDNINR